MIPLMKKKGHEKKTKAIFLMYKQTQTTDVWSTTTRRGWQEKTVLRDSAAAICLQGAADGEMLLLMK